MFNFPVVFVDIETTGGSARNSRVLEVAAIRYENGEVTAEFSTLLDPETYLPAFITNLTGITDVDVTGAPTFSAIADELWEVMNGAVFIAHNVHFDYGFLRMEFERLGRIFKPKLLCTVRLSRALYAEHKGHSLAKLIERHDITVDARHRALDDTRAILHFAQLAYAEHGQDIFDEAVARQLKKQYMPSHLDEAELTEVKNEPGVYVFEDEFNQPIYVGKSITLKKRVVSHFQDKAHKEMKIKQSIHHVRTIPTGNELAALILESKMVKELSPIFNRQLRRVSKYAMLIKRLNSDGFATIEVVSGTIDQDSELGTVYGVYETRTKAKNRIDMLTRTFGLCPKLMGIEKGKGACFSYSLHKCAGACIGRESTETYNRKFETALERTKLEDWPYESAIAIPINGGESGVVINKWIVQGFFNACDIDNLEPVESSFDVDEYKIIRRFIRENEHLIVPVGQLVETS